jgi:hypothetical protein
VSTHPPVGVEVLDNVWDRSPELITYLNSLDKWERAQVQRASKPVADYRTSSTLGVPLLSFNNPPIIHEFARTVWQKMSNYSLVYGVPVYEFESIIFNRYEAGQHFDTHPDYYRGSDRVFSAVFYLNTITDGGSTSFVHFDHAVEAVEGRLVIFPANYLFAHAGTAPDNQTKYSAAFWARG